MKKLNKTLIILNVLVWSILLGMLFYKYQIHNQEIPSDYIEEIPENETSQYLESKAIVESIKNQSVIKSCSFWEEDIYGNACCLRCRNQNISNGFSAIWREGEFNRCKCKEAG